MEKIACQELVQDIVTTLRPTALEKNISFTTQFPDKTMILHTDKRLLTQILINIISNAIKFTDKGGLCVIVKKKKLKNADMAIIEVIDTGIGITAANLEKLFLAFERLSITGSKREGTGLGLHISKKLADLIHVSFEVNSDDGKGTQFSIQIPLSIHQDREQNNIR